MKPRFFGDSFDIVKQSLVSWLSNFGDWTVHPMLTESVSADWASQFSRFLGAPLLSLEVLTSRTDREAYFQSSRSAGNLFLDPDKGLCMALPRPAKQPAYLLRTELLSLALARPESLTLLFDQSFDRNAGPPEVQVGKKLSTLKTDGIFGFAYVAQASFLVVGVNSALVGECYRAILSRSRLPAGRFVMSGAAATHSAASSF